MTKSDAIDTPSTDVAIPSDSAIAELDEYARALPTDDPELIQERIIRSIMTADSAAAILDAGAVTKGDDLLGIPLTVLDLRASNSDFEAGPDIFLHVDAKIIANGDTVTFATGARDVMIKLLMLHKRGFLPADVVMYRASKPTKAGFYPVFLRGLNADEADSKPF